MVLVPGRRLPGGMLTSPRSRSHRRIIRTPLPLLAAILATVCLVPLPAADAVPGHEPEMRLESGFVKCPTPAGAIDGGGFGNLEPLVVRRVGCGVGLKVATKSQCAEHHRCTVAGVDWTCGYNAISVESVRGRCHARAGRRVRWIAGGAG
jgi:hypothetical protein